MADFAPAITLVLKHEGHYVDNPNDPGGATNYGISLRFVKSLPPGILPPNNHLPLDAKYIKSLSINEAEQIYKVEFWDKGNFAQIINQTLANKVFDMAVNMGTHQAILLLQRAITQLNPKIQILNDGNLDVATITAVNSLNAAQLLAKYQQVLRDFYCLLAKEHPQFQVFLHGWINRVNDI